MKLRLGKASSSLQYPPIIKVFKHFNDPSGRCMMLRQSWIAKVVRKHNSPRSGIDLRLWHLVISTWAREWNSCRSGSDFRLEQSSIYNCERDVHNCSWVLRTSKPHPDILKRRRPCIRGKHFGLGQLRICQLLEGNKGLRGVRNITQFPKIIYLVWLVRVTEKLLWHKSKFWHRRNLGGLECGKIAANPFESRVVDVTNL